MGVGMLIRKQGLLYQLVSAAIGFATATIKRGIREAKAAYLKQLASRGRPHPADILSHLKKAGIGGAKAKAAS